MSMIALYKGTSIISRLIRFRTWSEFSHASWVDGDEEFEAWHTSGEGFKPGVRRVQFLGAGHTLGTEVHLFQCPELNAEQCASIKRFMISQIGKRYDWGGVLGFLSRRDSAQYQDRWFCSELIFCALLREGVDLLSRVPCHRVSPGMLALSPRLRFFCVRRAGVRAVAACDSASGQTDTYGADAYVNTGRPQ